MRTFVQGVVWRNKTTYFLRLDQVTARRKGHWRWAVPQAQEEGWDVATSYPSITYFSPTAKGRSADVSIGQHWSADWSAAAEPEMRVITTRML
jgi:hypothetical protein